MNSVQTVDIDCKYIWNKVDSRKWQKLNQESRVQRWYERRERVDVERIALHKNKVLEVVEEEDQAVKKIEVEEWTRLLK